MRKEYQSHHKPAGIQHTSGSGIILVFISIATIFTIYIDLCSIVRRQEHSNFIGCLGIDLFRRQELVVQIVTRYPLILRLDAVGD